MSPDCVSFRSRVEGYLSDSLPREEARQFRAHLRACPDCREIAIEQDSTLIFGLAALAEPVSRGPEAELEARAILENVRGAIAIREAARRLSPDPAPGPARRVAAAGAMAACLAALLFLNSSESPNLVATAPVPRPQPSRAAIGAAPETARRPALPALAAPEPLAPASATIYEWNPGPGSEAGPKIVWIVDRSFDI